jgi:ribonuclease P protein component
MNLKYSKKDKLKSKKLIEKLFSEGKVITLFPLRLVYLKTSFEDSSVVKTGISVSKKLHKNAIDRNKIKRLLREVYRLNKPKYFNNSSTPYAFMILYIGKEKPTFDSVNTKTQLLFQKFLKHTSIDETIS